jgi:hypothetical protein
MMLMMMGKGFTTTSGTGGDNSLGGDHTRLGLKHELSRLIAYQEPALLQFSCLDLYIPYRDSRETETLNADEPHHVAG